MTIMLRSYMIILINSYKFSIEDFRKMSIHSTSSSNFIPVPKQESKSSHSSKQSQYSISKNLL